MDLNLGSVSANELEVGYLGAYTGGTLPTITNIDGGTTFVPGDSVVLNGSNFSTTGGSIIIDGEAQTITARTATAITFTAVRGGNPYDTDLTLTYTDSGSNTATLTVQQVAGAGEVAVTAASPNTTDDASLWANLVDTGTGDPITIVGGDQALLKDVNTLGNLTATPAGEISADTEGDFVVQIWLALEGVWGSDQTVTFSEPAADTTPAAFTFTDQTGVDLGATVESNAITVTGVDAGENVAISITGGEYAVDSGSGFGAWTSTSGNVQLNDDVKVRHTSSASNSTATNTALTIGGVSDTFTSTTKAPADVTPSAFSFTDQTGVEPESVGESNAITITGVDAGEDVPVSIVGGQYAVDAGSGFGAYTTANTNVQLGYQVKVRNTASGSFSTATNTTLTAGGVSDTFTRTTRAAVLPTQDVVLPDLNVGQSETVSIDLDSYFSGASSYSVSGLPSESGYTFSGSTISGTGNSNDLAASPFTVTVTANSADGSIQDSFSVAVSDDIGPVISVFPLTTLDTTPNLTGNADDAVSLTLDVEGVDVTYSRTYNITPSAGSWAQLSEELALGTYTLTLNGVDSAGNAAVEQSTILNVVEQSVSTEGRNGFLKSAQRPIQISMKESVRA